MIVKSLELNHFRNYERFIFPLKRAQISSMETMRKEKQIF